MKITKMTRRHNRHSAKCTAGHRTELLLSGTYAHVTRPYISTIDGQMVAAADINAGAYRIILDADSLRELAKRLNDVVAELPSLALPMTVRQRAEADFFESVGELAAVRS